MRMKALPALATLTVLYSTIPAVAQAPPPVAPQAAQAPQPGDVIGKTVCDQPLRQPSAEPPAGSTFFYSFELCWPEQGNTSAVEYETYFFYTQLDERISQPAQGKWTPWDESLEELAIGDFKTLMQRTNFLDDMRIEVNDHVFPNGAVGKIVSYIMEERERVKIVEYRDTEGPIKLLKRTDIEEKLREQNIELRLDSFVDDRAIKRIKTVLDQMAAEKGFTDAAITHTITPVAGGPKLVNVTFIVSEGPKIKIRNVDFIGNRAFSDGTLERKMKENKPKGILSWITGGGTYKETAYEEDAARVMDFYQRKGYARATVGQPEIRVLENSKDGKEQWIELRIPVEEGARYRFRAIDFDGNTLAGDEGLGTLFDMDRGDWYSRKKLVDGIRKVTEVYGARGYMEANPFPMFRYSDQPDPVQQALDALVPEMLRAPQNGGVPNETRGRRPEDPTVDITLRIDEGPQYFVNRITFTGNTTTRDKVIRREMRLVEGDVFNSESLKYSVRRINQLGYFQQIQEQDTTSVDVKKNPTRENTVDVTLKLTEQNRNQLTFGAGVSQFEGVFGQLAFQTANFMGRGESLTVQMTAGDRSQNYQLAFTRPFLFDRNITGGFDIYKRSLDYIGYYTQRSTGANLIFGFRVADFSQMYMNYSFDSMGIRDLNEALIDSSCLLRETGCSIINSLGDLSQLTPTQVEIINRNPFLVESLLLGQGGSRTTSKLIPSFVHNTVDNPIFPNQGKRLTLSAQLALLGGNTKYYKPTGEFILFKRHLSRTSWGFRVQSEYITPHGASACKNTMIATAAGDCTNLPIFERLFLGGEYSVRGFDIRSIGPTLPNSRIVLGGNKSLLFNAEYLISLASQVRLVLFYDAGQVRDVGQKFAWKEDLTELVPPPTPPLFDPFATSSLTPVGFQGVTTRVVGQTSAFKTSTGIELRFFMPVLNVPFRLIYAYNPQREGVLDNNLRPQKETVFRFAVGTTF